MNATIARGTAREQRSHHETADEYHRVVARLSDGWRVVVSKDGIQWVLQRRDGERAGRARWAGVRFCRTRQALIRDARALCGPVDPAALAILVALPEHFGAGRKPRRVKR